MLGVVLVALLACASTSFAAKPKPSLSVTRVADPIAVVSAGTPFAVSGRVKNSGKKAAPATVRVSLRRGAEPRPGGIDLGRIRAGEVRPGDVGRFRDELEVPTGTVPGDYGLTACVPKRGRSGDPVCEMADGRITVTGPPLAPPGGETGPTDPPPADPELPAPPANQFSPGARSAGDVLFPEAGNGGYDVDRYEVALDYDPLANNFDSAQTTITAEATQNLSEFSLDMQGMNVTAVTVDGAAAQFSRTETKLVVDPAGDGIPDGQSFTAIVAYNGEPQEVTDPDDSKEGWIRDSGPVPDGGFVVNEPIGAQGWFPNNNHPSDKAAYDYLITVPSASTALGNGELVARTANGDGTDTWHWREDDPTASYLTTATVGTFLYSEGSFTETTPGGATLDEYRAIDATYLATQPVIESELDRIEGMTNYLGGFYGPYPFDSTGAVIDSAPLVGYALEVQTKPHFATPLTSGSRSTLLHEVAHQWMGNSVSPAMWSDIWFNEGWAVWSEWIWADEENGSATTPEQRFDTFYADGTKDWTIAPAVLDGDPANLFVRFPVYDRPAMMLQGYREIVTHPKFLELAGRLQTDFGHGNISTQEFIDLAIEVSDFSGADRDRLADYFQEWLYGETKPTITPDNFF